MLLLKLWVKEVRRQMGSSHCTSLTPQDMVVHNVGSGLATVFPDLDGKKINDAFLLARPLVEFTWNMVTYDRFHRRTVSVLQFRWNQQLDFSVRLWIWNEPWSDRTQIISHPNNLFEIVSKEPVKRERNLHNRVQSKSGSHANTHRGVFLVVEDFLACGRISPFQKKWYQFALKLNMALLYWYHHSCLKYFRKMHSSLSTTGQNTHCSCLITTHTV